MRRRFDAALAGMSLIAMVLWYHVSAVYADKIHLKNGDHLTGTILAITEKKLLLRTEYAGELAIRRQEVIELRTDGPMAVAFVGGKKRIGWLDVTDEGGNFLLTNAGPVFFRPVDIAMLRPLTEAEAQRADLTGRPAMWKSHLEFGAQLRSGNTEATDITLQFHSWRIARHSELQTSVAASFGMTEGERTTQQALGSARFDFLRTPRLFSFTQLNLVHDLQEELVLRAEQQGGAGYKFIRTPQTLLQGIIGIGLQEELFEGEDVAVTPIGRLGIEWTQRVGSTSELAFQTAFIPNLMDLGEFRLDSEASLRTPITHRFLLRFSLTHRYDSDPQPDVKSNDLTLLSSIVWDF